MNIVSPVPKNQQPVEEYIDISKSWFFSYAKNNTKFNFLLFISWVLAVLFYIFVGTGSYYLIHHKLVFISQSISFSLIIPLLLCLRMYLGWNYIFNRLNSEVVIYEESDWHDGQIWKKPTSWKQKEKLIATIEIKPLLQAIKLNSLILLNLLLFGIFINLVIQFIN